MSVGGTPSVLVLSGYNVPTQRGGGGIKTMDIYFLYLGTSVRLVSYFHEKRLKAGKDLPGGMVSEIAISVSMRQPPLWSSSLHRYTNNLFSNCFIIIFPSVGACRIW